MHRIGRTARAGKIGNAISILSIKEAYHFKEMLKKASKLPSVSKYKILQKELFEQISATVQTYQSLFLVSQVELDIKNWLKEQYLVKINI